VLIRARSVFSCAPALAYADRISVREYVFYVFSKFKKRLFHVFFEMTCQKNVENIIKVSVCLHTWPSPSVSTHLHLEVCQIAGLHCALWNNKQLHIHTNYIKLLIQNMALVI